MDTKFTKGEWEIFGDWGIRAKRSERQLADNVCHATFEYDRGGSGEGFANANLIAAAPDMYAMLEELSGISENYQESIIFWIHENKNKVEELLAKARGE